MSFLKELIDDIELQLLKDEKEAQRMLEHVLGTNRQDLDQQVPTPKELRRFLCVFAELVKKANPGHTRRAKVIEGLLDLYDAGEGVSKYKGISAEPIYYQLALRVRHPSKIDQGKSNWCGPTAILAAHAKDNPEDYTRFAHELVTTGISQFNNISIKVHTSVLDGFSRECPEVDYVTLSAMRSLDAADHWFVKVAQAKKGLCFPDFAAHLKLIGYSHVHTHQLIYNGASLPGPSMIARSNLGSARNSLERRKLVFLSVKGKFINAIIHNPKLDKGKLTCATTDTVALPSQFTIFDPSNHWVLAHKIDLDTAANTVSMRFTSWAKKYQAKMNIEEFLKYYGGYVSGQP